MPSNKPRQITDKEIEQIKILAGLGIPIQKISLVLGISESTLYRRKRVDPRVKQAYDEGAAKAEYAVARTLYSMAVDDRNLSAVIWWEKTRYNRSDRVEVKQAEQQPTQVFVYLPDNDREAQSTGNADTVSDSQQ